MADYSFLSSSSDDEELLSSIVIIAAPLLDAMVVSRW
jgi:hypothetical protein